MFVFFSVCWLACVEWINVFGLVCSVVRSVKKSDFWRFKFFISTQHCQNFGCHRALPGSVAKLVLGVPNFFSALPRILVAQIDHQAGLRCTENVQEGSGSP